MSEVRQRDGKVWRIGEATKRGSREALSVVSNNLRFREIRSTLRRSFPTKRRKAVTHASTPCPITFSQT